MVCTAKTIAVVYFHKTKKRDNDVQSQKCLTFGTVHFLYKEKHAMVVIFFI